MSNLKAAGIDDTTGQFKQVGPGDTLVDSQGTPLAGAGASSATISQIILSANEGFNTGFQKVSLDTAVFDPAGVFDAANNQLTIPSGLNNARVKIKGAVYYTGGSWSTTGDEVGIRIMHKDNTGTPGNASAGGPGVLGVEEHRHPPINGVRNQFAHLETPSFVVSTGDQIELYGVSIVFVAGRFFLGGATPVSLRCYLELITV